MKQSVFGLIPISPLLDRFNKRTRHISRCYGQQSVNYDSYTLLSMVTRNLSYYSLECTINDTYSLPSLKFPNLRWHNNDIFCIGCTDDFEAFYLTVWDDEWFFNKLRSFVEMAIVETEVGEVYVVVNKGFHLFLCSACKEYIWKA